MLKRGDKVLLSDGTLCEVEGVSCKKLSAPETTYNLEVADFHTYYVSDACVLVHNECWGTTRRKYWKKQAQGWNDGSITSSYNYAESFNLNGENINNLDRMSKGLAPIGFDGKSVHLHHVAGRGSNMIVEMMATDHIAFHKLFGFKNFIDIFVL